MRIMDAVRLEVGDGVVEILRPEPRCPAALASIPAVVSSDSRPA